MQVLTYECEGRPARTDDHARQLTAQGLRPGGLVRSVLAGPFQGQIEKRRQYEAAVREHAQRRHCDSAGALRPAA